MLDIFKKLIKQYRDKKYPLFKVRIYRKGKNNCSRCDHYRSLYAMVKKESVNLHTSTANWTYRNICYQCINEELTKYEKNKRIRIIIDAEKNT